jgi:hypothetical protein
VIQEDVLAQAEGEIVTGLIQVYRALGGGWQIRLRGCNEGLPPPGVAPPAWKQPPESVEAPAPEDVKPAPLPEEAPAKEKK